MKHEKRARDGRETYRPTIRNRQENRPTFDRFPEAILYPMNLYKLK